MNKYKGIIYTALSAFIFGFTPILTKLTYSGGGNGITITFLRSTLALPILFIILTYKKIPLSLSKKEMKQVFIMGIFGTAMTTITLYVSYNYINVGMATSIHFIYPVLVTLCCILFFGDSINKKKIFALLFGTSGILFLMDVSSSSSYMGLILALISGVTYAFYIVYMEKSGLKNLYYFKLSFYICIAGSALSGIFGLYSHQLTLSLTPTAWFYAFLVSIFTSVGALSLLQIGISLIGATNAAMLSTIEPITGVLLGMLILGETMTLPKAVGCLLITISVFLIASSQGKSETTKKEVSHEQN